jgi:RNA polymerase sigma-70 factor, ECF subfamily
MSNNTQETAPSVSLKALQAGDQDEIAKFVEVYSTPVYRLALRMVSDTQDAEDVLQETFIKAIRALPQFEGRSSLTTWLYRIAMNEALMQLRKRKNSRIQDLETEGEDGEEIEEPRILADWCCLPESELATAETRKVLDAAVQQISPGLRAVFLLRDGQGLSISETAQALNLTESAVKVRLMRARLKLREILSGYFGERMEALK